MKKKPDHKKLITYAILGGAFTAVICGLSGIVAGDIFARIIVGGIIGACAGAFAATIDD